MKTNVIFHTIVGPILVSGLFFFLSASILGAPERPELEIHNVSPTQFNVSWISPDSSWVLERAANLQPPINWQPATETPTRTGNNWTITLSSTDRQQYLRLRTQSSVTRILETSPPPGETGVAVTRETVLRFSEPLSPNALLTIDQLHAEFGGRRLLGRVQVSSDRRTATLFYLENLPGSARVRVTFDGDQVMDARNRPVDGDGDGQPGGLLKLDFETVSITALDGTAVIGTVMASELVAGANNLTNVVNRPLAGAIITVDGREQELRAVTDALGNFTLNPAPVGRFFVKVDGRTAAGSQWPNGAYYPIVGKAWDAIGGKKNNLAGGNGVIYLPLIPAGTLQSVNVNTDTLITFTAEQLQKNPALQGVSLTVPANSLFSDNGGRGGRVGIAPVSPDRLPETLPPGLKFPLVITVQTDGPSNFDRPVGVRFPNLPDPDTGVTLKPGEKSALFSFNHDTGKWELQGPMTVSQDGRFIESDPGIGIRQPGWHGATAGTPGNGPTAVEVAAEHDPVIDEILEHFIEEEASSSECAGDAAKLAQDITNVSDAVGVLLAVAGGSQQVKDDYAGGRYSVSQICTTVTLLESQRSAIEDLLTRLRGGPSSSLDRIQAVLNCVRAILNRLKSDCADMESAAPVFIPASVRNTCQAIAKAENVISVLEDLGGFILTLDLNDVYTQVADIKNYIGCVGFSAATPAPGAPHIRLQAPAIPDPVLVQKLDKLAQSFSKFKGISDTDWEFVGEFINEANDTHTAVAGAVPNAYIRVEYGQTVQRGRANSFGQYSFFMPVGTYYSVSAYDPATGQCGRGWAKSAPAGFPTEIHGPPMGRCDATDGDGDGLSDFVEGIIGTKPDQKDSDGDGLSDGAEVGQGFNPLDPNPPPLGVVFAVKTGDRAITDICVENDLAVVCEGERGLELFNIFNPLNPFLVGRINPGTYIERASCSESKIAALDRNNQRLLVIDASDLTNARVVHEVSLSFTGATSVEARAGLAYVGLESGELLVVELGSGVILGQTPVTNGEPINDLDAEGGWMYALTPSQLIALELVGLEVVVRGQLDIPDNAERLFVGGGIAYLTHQQGFDIVDLRNPGQPSLIASGPTGPRSWNQLVVNGTGLGIALAGEFGSNDARTLDLRDPAKRDQTVATFPITDGPVVVALHDGRALLGTRSGSLQVLNYQTLDTAGKAPIVALSGNFGAAPPTSEEGALVSLIAQVTEDVQIRRVEFYLDGQRVWTDGAFPFQYHFRAPRLEANRKSFLLRARAVDGGGTEGWSQEVTVTLLADRTAPRVLATIPADGSNESDVVRRVTIGLTEPMDVRSLSSATIQIVEAGPDHQPGTSDDVPVTDGIVQYQPGTLGVSLVFQSGGLPTGNYRAIARASIQDVAGNPLGTDFNWEFNVSDVASPAVVSVSPARDAIIPGGLRQVVIRLSEPLRSGGLALFQAGPDGYVNTPDDVPVPEALSQFANDRQGIVLSFPAPLGPGHYRAELKLETQDLSGNPVQEEAWSFSVPVQTSIRGSVVTRTGTPVAGASVRLSGVQELLTTTAEGTFSRAEVSLDARFEVYGEARATVLGQTLFGRSSRTASVHQGTTQLPAIVLQETCEPRFASGLFPPLGLPAPVNCFGIFTDGNGPALYAGLNNIGTGEGLTSFPVVKWTGQQWLPVGGRFSQVFEGNTSTFAQIKALLEFDDGTGRALYAGGFFNQIDGADIAGLAKWNGSNWQPVGGELTGLFGVAVTAMAVYNDGTGPDLYVAGQFTKAGNVNVQNIAKWDGQTWSALGAGIPFGLSGAPVTAMAVYKGSLYVAGDFLKIGDLDIRNIARWDGKAWSAVGTGVSGSALVSARDLEVYRDELYVCGAFSDAGGLAVNSVAKWNGTQWSALGKGISQSGFPGTVESMAVFTANQQTDLYVIGLFDRAGDAIAQGIAKWNGTAWSSLEGPDAQIGGGKTMLSFDDGSGSRLFVGYEGVLISRPVADRPTIFIPADHAARWDGQSWSPAGPGLGGSVRALATFGGGNTRSLYAGGDFTYAGVRVAHNLARRTGDLWEPLGTGTDGPVSALAEFSTASGNELYVGGEFTQAGGVPAHGIARWNGSQWSALGSGVETFIPPRFTGVAYVYALLPYDDGSGKALYAGGFFNRAGGKEANAVARWNGTDWTALGKGFVGEVRTLVAFDDGTGSTLYAGGSIERGDPSAPRVSGVAKWTGTQWIPLGTEGRGNLNSAVLTLAVHDAGTGPALYAAGQFGGLEGSSSRLPGVARWNGTNWVPLGAGLTGTIHGLTSFDDGFGPSLYAGGVFESVATPALSHVARWDGNEWLPLANGLGGIQRESGVRTLLVFDDGSGPGLLFGGAFRWAEQSPRLPSHSIAKWYRPVPPCPPAP